MVFPAHLEQSMTAGALHGLGVAYVMAPNAPEEAVIQTMRRAAADTAAQDRAAALARNIEARGPRPGVAPIVAACEDLLAHDVRKAN
jgi:2-methylisocitrate lyase-like PEP mutase family enzyme